MIRGLIFDFDGLIHDTELAEFAAGWFDPLAHRESLLGRTLDGEALRAQHQRRHLLQVACLEDS
jgi:beta-phosphoglucomutase-like phosphatase (HAD superfamily)